MYIYIYIYMYKYDSDNIIVIIAIMMCCNDHHLHVCMYDIKQILIKYIGYYM
jgi:hypothetical protein